MPEQPPDLEHAPPKWKEAFRALKAYAVATGLSKVVVTVQTSTGETVPAQVDLEETADGIVVNITIPP